MPLGPQPGDWPSIASVAGAVLPSRNNLPPAAVLPDRLIHSSRRIIPGQFAGIMGPRHDPWFIEAAPFSSTSCGAFPEYEFDHQDRPNLQRRTRFEAPSLSLLARADSVAIGKPHASSARFSTGSGPISNAVPRSEQFDRYRQGAISLLTDRRIRDAIDIHRAPAAEQEQYGKNSFGWSLLMARRLVEAGVSSCAGASRQRRDVGHARRGVSSPARQALSANRSCRLGPARRFARTGPVGIDVDRHGRRVRPHSEDQPSAAVL